MFIIRFFKWIRGYVRFSARGGFPERFINLCPNNGILIWNLKSCDGVLYANTDIKGYRRIRPIAKKSGMRVKIYRRYGLPFFLHKHRKRVGLVFGLIAFAVIVSTLSGSIWNVRVEGNRDVGENIIISAFENAGLRVGVRAKKLNFQDVERKALKELNSLLWVSLNFDGSTAVIEVREKVAAPAIQDKKNPSNIVASKPGQIVVLEPFEGTVSAGIGTAVCKGDLIINSVTENKDGTVAFKHAKGYVVARTEENFTSAQTLDHSCFSYTGERSHYTIYFFGIKIPLGPTIEPNGDFEQYDSEQWLEIKGIKLPVSLIRREFLTISPCETSATFEQARLMSLENLHNITADALKNSKVIESSFSLSSSADSVTANGNFICHENIGVEKELIVEQDAPAQSSKTN